MSGVTLFPFDLTGIWVNLTFNRGPHSVLIEQDERSAGKMINQFVIPLPQPVCDQSFELLLNLTACFVKTSAASRMLDVFQGVLLLVCSVIQVLVLASPAVGKVDL